MVIFTIFILIAAAPAPAFAAEMRNRSRLVILMVWDGLRPDAVTPTATPNLFALTHGGVYFAAHHALYPSLTMVNAAGLATGAASGANGIVANSMYLAHLLGAGMPKLPTRWRRRGPCRSRWRIHCYWKRLEAVRVLMRTWWKLKPSRSNCCTRVASSASSARVDRRSCSTTA